MQQTMKYGSFLILTVMLLTSCRSTEQSMNGDNTNSNTPLVVMPGAPGQPSRVLTDGEGQYQGALPYTEADVEFMQGMIPHHAQASDMSVLVPERTQRREIQLLAQRIIASQKSEITMMKTWLSNRDEELPSDHAHHMMQMGGKMKPMPGMLSGDQMKELEASTGIAFERLYLQYMIMHHQGAITMVDELFSSTGAAQDSDIFGFATDVESDQSMEIRRMQAMLDNTPGG